MKKKTFLLDVMCNSCQLDCVRDRCAVVKILWIKYATRFRIHALYTQTHKHIQNNNDNEKVLVVILVIEKANLIRNKKNGNINTWQWILDFDSSLQQINAKEK